MEAKEHRYSDFVRKLVKACSRHEGLTLKTLGKVDDQELHHISLNPEG